MKKIRVAVDGPVASGKSSVSKQAAKALSMTYIDTGSMYRLVTFLVLEQNISFDDVASIVKVIETCNMKLEGGRIFTGSRELTDEIRQDAISNNTAKIAAIKEVREKVVAIQKQMIKSGNVIMDGRDIGTVVIPDAEVKIFLTASVKARAERRYLDNQRRGISCDLDTIEKEIQDRDYLDTTRKESPLKMADDAILLDTSDLDYEQSIQAMVDIIKTKL